MMKKIILISFAALSLMLKAQSVHITNTLSEKLAVADNNSLLKVNLIFKNQVNFQQMNQQFKENNIPLDVRAKKVMKTAMQLAESEQRQIVNLLSQNASKVKSIKQFWLINMMTVEIEKSLLTQFLNHSLIEYVEEYDYFHSKPIEVEKGTETQKSINGNEPGLSAINAPALWAMGYTGKARKFYSIDTGVWPNHPAISNAWLGNYQPINQAWYAVDAPTPVDKSSSHGTHTTGTVLGLEQATNDTIGVAFNAYFMAADPIVDNIALIKPLPDYIDVFEFAFNPDGDTSTTHDMPDAINNSWGIDTHDDTTICAGYVTQMFDAVEAAGIANVFSAGNEGPGATTIGQPQYVSTGLVNTFTVGAVNGANASFPIANFSSRGPSPCPNLSGSLLIKPEVVAPGMNVRSCIDQNNYANYNGTSMAGPHATGAVLLLKEAFPNVSGEDILLALYYSAIDLGDIGEDNTYGMGMIDVLAAYNYLALTHTPTPPNNIPYDVTITEILSPTNNIQCQQDFNPIVVVKNNGDSTISNIYFSYHLNNEALHYDTLTRTLIPGDTVHVNLPTITAQTLGNYELLIKAALDTSINEIDFINNQRAVRFNIRETVSILPFYENFENTQLDSSNWFIENPDVKTTWDTLATMGLMNSNYSAYINLYDYAPRQSQKDAIITPKIKLPNRDSLFIKFDVAYQMRLSVIADTLVVYVSDDCGATYTQVYKKGGTDLQTKDTLTNNFVPQYASHWRTDYIDIAAYGGSDILVKFESINRQGNNLFLDNIWVYQGVEPVTIQENNMLIDVKVYPNPTNGLVTLEMGENDLNNASYQLIDMLGKQLKSQQIVQSKMNIDISGLKQGIYFLNVTNNNGRQVLKLIKN
jgi:hypothetical protein|tara:strand:- start:42131 stop:44731 length:2601 start_codon:yes stop_codon:yes gene_type:complete